MKGSVPADSVSPGMEARSQRVSVPALRKASPIRMWGGKGCGAVCDLCHAPLTAADIEYEVEADLEDERVTLHFHPRCHDKWKNELDRAELALP